VNAAAYSIDGSFIPAVENREKEKQVKIILSPVSIVELWSSREAAFEDILKIVVDVEKNIFAADAELHADLEQILLEQGSRQEVLWGVNLYPLKGKESPDFLEYTAMINVRPSFGNKTMEVADQNIRDRIRDVVFRFLV
jgi:hypothetical protein